MKKTFVDVKDCFLQFGFVETWKRFRWKFILVFFLGYLVRDTFLYLILPALIGAGLLGKF